MRYAALTLYGLIQLGYTQEAAAFMHRAGARCGELRDGASLQIM
jgi:hypothetical protein